MYEYGSSVDAGSPELSTLRFSICQSGATWIQKCFKSRDLEDRRWLQEYALHIPDVRFLFSKRYNVDAAVPSAMLALAPKNAAQMVRVSCQ